MRLGEQDVMQDAAVLRTLLGGYLPNVIRQQFTKALPDNVATGIFTVTTTNEAGDNDHGYYSCHMQATVSNGAPQGACGAANSAAKSWQGHFCRAMSSTGVGALSAVSEVSESASAATDPAVRDIGTVTCTAAEAGEYVTTVSFLADHTGTGDARLAVTVLVELVWYGFLTPPKLAAA